MAEVIIKASISEGDEIKVGYDKKEEKIKIDCVKLEKKANKNTKSAKKDDKS